MATDPNAGQNMGQNMECAVPKKICRNLTIRGRGNRHAPCVSSEDAIQRKERIATLNCHLLTSSSESSRFRVCSVGVLVSGRAVVSQRCRMTARVRTRTELSHQTLEGGPTQMQRDFGQGRRVKKRKNAFQMTG